MIKTVAPALKCLLERLIDYAGLFPPAKIPLDAALAKYEQYTDGDYKWMLRWFVVGTAELANVPESFDGSLSILGDTEQSRAATIESNAVVSAHQPVYCEVPLDQLERLEQVKQAGCFAKIRTGGLKPEAIPSPAQVASFIVGCADRKLSFKATAGLHHPIRAEQNLTYEPNAPRAVMHGFINVLMASAFAWHGERNIEPIIAEVDPQAFRFNDRAYWREKSLSLSEINDARQNFMHSIGSCSFEEPIQDLKALGLL
jgi:hypothetical protein